VKFVNMDISILP